MKQKSLPNACSILTSKQNCKSLSASVSGNSKVETQEIFILMSHYPLALLNKSLIRTHTMKTEGNKIKINNASKVVTYVKINETNCYAGVIYNSKQRSESETKPNSNKPEL